MISNRKITAYQDNVTSLSDRPAEDGITAAQLKAIFDGRTDKEVKSAINGIIDDLTSEAVGSSGADNIKATPISGVASNTVQGILEGLGSKKVEKVAGKQLSTEDYSTAEKNKLAAIEAGANNYVLPKASTATLGGIKIGVGLEAMPDGTVNGVAAPAPDLIARQEIADHAADTSIHTTPQQKVLTLDHSAPSGVQTLAGLPTAPGLYSCQFIAAADYNEGDQWADGWTAKTQMGEELPPSAFKMGANVSLVADTAAKLLTFVCTDTKAYILQRTASFSLTQLDNAKIIEVSSASAVTITIPTNVNVEFPVGTQITIVRAGAGDVTVSAASGVTLYSSENKVKIDKQHQAATLIKVATDAWRLIGALA